MIQSSKRLILHEIAPLTLAIILPELPLLILEYYMTSRISTLTQIMKLNTEYHHCPGPREKRQTGDCVYLFPQVICSAK